MQTLTEQLLEALEDGINKFDPGEFGTLGYKKAIHSRTCQALDGHPCDCRIGAWLMTALATLDRARTERENMMNNWNVEQLKEQLKKFSLRAWINKDDIERFIEHLGRIGGSCEMCEGSGEIDDLPWRYLPKECEECEGTGVQV